MSMHENILQNKIKIIHSLDLATTILRKTRWGERERESRIGKLVVCVKAIPVLLCVHTIYTPMLHVAWYKPLVHTTTHPTIID